MNIQKLIESYFPVQYVYSYPTTRSYKPVQFFSYDQVEFGTDINVYIHIPFCDQKCSFCGYLTVIEKKYDERELYVDALIKEILAFAPYVQNKTVRSINFGGGTPMLLSESQVHKVINALRVVFPNFQATAIEISIEATPESVTYEKVSFLKSLGFNRISVGIQTLEHSEIMETKRHNFSEESIKAIEIIKNSGIENLCIDLMYGLPSQTTESWISTLNGIIEYLPETIELYRMVVIPKTGIAKHIDPSIIADWKKKYEMYKIAKKLLLAAGYVQESHVRFVIPQKGFYVQQTNIFKGQSLIGFGVGARTYAQNMHYRNIYSTIQSKNAVRRYIKEINDTESVVESIIDLSSDELTRRYIIYNLEHLDLDLILNNYRFDMLEKYSVLLQIYVDLGLYKKIDNSFILTDKGVYHRDLIAYSFFSENSMYLEKHYYGEFLKDW
jgi:oxygen-independent coproporphyrinogen-3 oxidase